MSKFEIAEWKEQRDGSWLATWDMDNTTAKEMRDCSRHWYDTTSRAILKKYYKYIPRKVKKNTARARMAMFIGYLLEQAIVNAQLTSDHAREESK